MIAFTASDRRNAVVAGLALGALALALFSPGLLNDPDTWWHVKVGGWILDHHQAPRVDLWSYSRAGAAWTAHEWLSEALMAAAYRLAGWAGVTALCGAAFSLATWLMGRRLARDLEGTLLLVVLVLGLSLMGGSLLARPHLLALPVLVAWVSGLMAARDRGTAPSPWLCALMVLWANLHGGWAFGLAIAGPFGLEALIAAGPGARLKVVRDWGLFGTLALACAALTPFGLEGVMFPIQQLSMKSLAGIGEWRPADFSHLEPMEIALLALIGLALTRPIKLPPVRLALLVGMIHLALSHGRHQMLLGVVGPMLLAAPLANGLAAPREASAPGRWVGALATGLAVALLMLRLALPITRGDSANAPMSALDSVPAAVRASPVLNDYSFGGYLIWRDVRPYVDSRAELYRDAFLDNYGSLAAGDAGALEATLAARRVGWTIFPPGAPAVALMDREPGWTRIHADRFAVVHARTQP
ncbi:hypothetical protein [Phenylobacterium aquaticum]|uniref:hypothetical protein n=1 Tax=Phenylobacterium aquaticum TaxID=1763816 RepID=UPI0026F24753|nr:hypothetical protein [Phenylobacterium aquaticum]